MNSIRFSNYYLAPGSRMLSIAIGLILGGLGGLFFGVSMGILIACGIAILSSFLLPLTLYLADRPYVKLKEGVKGPYLVDERVRFTIKDGSMGGFFILTETQMAFLSIEKGEHMIQLSKENVRSITMSERGVIQVFLNDTQYIGIITGASEELFEIIRDNGWNVVGSL